MKKIFLLTMMISVTISVIYAHNYSKSVLNIRLSDGADLKVYVDGMQALTNNHKARIENISQGRHFIQVYRIDNAWGYEALDNVFRGNMDIAANTETFATIDLDCNKLVYDRVVSLYTDYEHHEPITTCHYPKHPQGRPFINPRPVLNQVTCDVPIVPCSPVAMNSQSFNQLCHTIDNAGFENTRMNIFKQAVAGNYFTSAQVQQLMNLFWFESSKLEIAKLAYTKTIDPQNYYIVNNSFGFSNSVRELNEYLAMR